MSFLGRVEQLLEERARAQAMALARDTEDSPEARALELAEALANADRLRELLGNGFTDRDRAFEAVLARFPNAPANDVHPAAEGEALAERTLQLAEALRVASERTAVFEEGLSDRDRSSDVLQARWRERLQAETLARTASENELQQTYRNQLRRANERLEERTLQLAASLVAADETRVALAEVLRINREVFGLFAARVEAERRAAIRQPGILRRALRKMKRALPAPIARVIRRR